MPGRLAFRDPELAAHFTIEQVTPAGASVDAAYVRLDCKACLAQLEKGERKLAACYAAEIELDGANMTMRSAERNAVLAHAVAHNAKRWSKRVAARAPVKVPHGS